MQQTNSRFGIGKAVSSEIPVTILGSKISHRDTFRARIWFGLFIVSLLVIYFSGSLIPGIDFDWLNIVPLAAALYAGFFLVKVEEISGHIPYVHQCLSTDASASKPRGSLLLSRPFRSCLIMGLAVLTLEFGLRCLSYHRSLVYETQGDLLFTPAPNQEYIEKISLSHSRINSYGLRGGPVDSNRGKELILCLGDSVTYGYGVDDSHTYPALLQVALDREFPGRYSVLNGGVDAYPIPFEDQKFLYLWNRDLHPSLVIVSYSFNEGWLGHLVDSTDEIKQEFARRVLLKNYLRSFALYNVVVENLARDYYDRMKGRLTPGLNFALSREDLDKRYEGYLERILSDLRSRNVEPVFLLPCSLNSRTGHCDTEGPLRSKFADFAKKNGLPLLPSDEMLYEGKPANIDVAKYFVDRVHMNELGTQKVATKLAQFLPTLLEKTSQFGVNSGTSLSTSKTQSPPNSVEYR